MNKTSLLRRAKNKLKRVLLSEQEVTDNHEQLIEIRHKAFLNKINSLELNANSEKGIFAVLTPASPGSLGDSAMLKSLLKLLKVKNEAAKLYPIGYKKGDEWNYLEETKMYLPNAPEEVESFAESLLKYEHVYIIGADIIDGKYSIVDSLKRLYAAGICQKLNIPCTVTGFSFNKSCPDIIVDYINQLPDVRFCLRDPKSASRFREKINFGFDELVDLAFNLKPDYDGIKSHESYSWLEKQKTLGRVILGVNLCPLTQDNSDETVSNYLELYAKVLTNFLKNDENVSVFFVAHDYRKLKNDMNLALILEHKLHDFKERVSVLREKVDSDMIKAYASKLDFVFSGRMHFAIACMGVSTPVACMTYQDKFKGLYDLFELDSSKLLCSYENLTEEAFIELLNFLKLNKTELRDHIGKIFPKVLDISAQNVLQVNS